MTEETKKSLGKRVMEIPYWYHKIELPDGVTTPGWAPLCPERYGLPEDLTGKRILDIGAWDGYWTWEALKRGAKEVVAIDDFSDYCAPTDGVKRNKWDTFDLCREAFGFNEELGPKPWESGWQNNKTGQKVSRLGVSFFDIGNSLGYFDIVFCFGMIYHFKYPYLALEKISEICDGELYIETAALDDCSPYRGGVGHGYSKNDVVMEFYPTNQYGDNVNNWWIPTLQCLGFMVESVGFKNVKAWGLTDNPKEVPECRGFVYGSKTGYENKNVTILSDTKSSKPQLKVAAVMSVPRLGFQDNSFCVFQGLSPFQIPLQKTTGAYWGQCLERGIQTQIDTHNPDAILTIDYDTVFTPKDVETLMKLMRDNPQADAIVPIQMGRGDMQALLTIKTRTGQVRDLIQREEFKADLIKIATGHFGLTLIRTESLLKLPHPWFKGEPNKEGQWGGGRIDDDIYFWKKMEENQMNIYSANRVVIGHMELVVKWPDYNLAILYQPVSEYHEKGKPEKVWR